MALTKIKNISIDPSFLITGNEINSTFTLTSKTVTVGTPATNTEAANKLYVDNAVAAVYNFKTVAVSGQSNIVADSAAATITVAGSGGIVVTTDAATDTLDIGTNATSNNTANTLVVRDGSGNFSANVVTADLDGTLVNARDISLGGDATGTASFDASSNITITTTLASTGVVAQTYGSATQVGEFTVDAKGRITSASNISIAIPSTQITDWQEAVEDVAGLSLQNGTHPSITFTYDDSTGLVSSTLNNPNKFDRIAVSGQTTVVADTETDTVTFAGSTGLTITTDATTDVITFTNSGVTSAAVSGTGLSINASTGAITITSNATALNTASTIVARDASGDFAAGVITADLLGDVTGDLTGNVTSTGLSSFSNISVTGGVIDDAIIGGTTPQAVTGTTITATTQFTGDLVGNVTGDITSTGTSTFSTVDINGGNIDGTTIGGSTPAAGTFTNLAATGSLNIDGGVLYVDPTTNFVGINDLTPAAALDVNGDAIVTGSMTVNTNLTVDGNLTVLGTTTTVSSTVTTIVDPVITVGQGTYVSNDGKGRGIEFKYYDTQSRIGFMGYDTTDGKFKLLKSASNNTEVFTGTKATLEANLDGYLVNARDIELTGDVTGLTPFDGSANIQIASTLANTGVTAGSYGAVDEVATFTVDAKGRLTAAGVATIAISSGQVTDFVEAVEDAAAGMITRATHTNVSVSYDDGAGTLSFSVPGAEAFSNIVVSGQTTVAADIANDTVTFAGSTGLTITTDALTDTVTFTNDGVTSAAVSGVGLSINASTGAITITSDATSNNTASTIVSRDASGNFSAGDITADLIGNASTASAWETTRTVTFATGDVTGSFNIDGSGDVNNVVLTIEPDSVALGTDTTGDYVEDLIAGTGIQISNTGGEGSTPTITNSDKGSDQNIFKTIAVAGQTSVTAASNTETLNLAAGTGVTLTTDNTTKTVTITNAGLDAFKYVAVAGQTTVAADAPDDTLTLVGGTAISLSTNATTDAITIQNDGVTSLSTSGVGISVNTNTGVVTLTSDATPTNTAGTIVSRDANGAFNAGDIGAEDITADSLTTVNGVTVGTLTATRVTFAGTAGLLSDNSDFTYTVGTNTLGVSNINATTSITSPSITDSGLTATRVTFAGTGGLLSDDADFTYNTTTDTLSSPNVTASGTVQGLDVKATSLTSGRVTFAAAGGQLVDDADLTFNTSTDTLSSPNVTASGTVQGLDVKATSLTSGRVVLAGASGQLVDDGDLTYNTGTDTLNAINVTASGTVQGLDVKATSLTSGRVTFAAAGGQLVDNSDLTYNTGTNTLGATNVTASATVQGLDVKATSLTSTRVVFAGTGGQLVDDADMTFNTATNTLVVTNVDATMIDAGSVNIATNVISVASGDIKVVAGTGSALDVDTHKIINVVDPTNAQDAATKKYVDDQIDLIDGLTIDGDSGGPSSVDFATQTLTIAGTANEIETAVSGQTITIGLPSDVTIGNNLTITGNITGVVDISTTGNVTIGGDLTVQGTLTSIETTNTQITDNTIVLNQGEAGAGVSSGTSGVEIDRGSSDNATVLWNETTDTWELKVGTAWADFEANAITANGAVNGGAAEFTSLNNTPIGATTASTGKFTTLTSTDLTPTRVVFVGASDELVDDADLTYDTATDTLSSSNLKATSLTATRVTFAGTNGLLSDDADLTYTTGTDTLNLVNMNITGNITGNLIPAVDVAQDLGSSTHKWRDLYLSGSSIELGTQSITSDNLGVRGKITTSGDFSTNDIDATSIKLSGITSTRVIFASTSGLLTDDADLTYDTATDTLSTVNVTASATVQGLDVKATSLTQGRVTFAGTGGQLIDDSALTFDGTTDTLSTVNVTASGTVQGLDVKATSLTQGRVTFAGTGGQLVDDADMTYDGTTNILTVPNVAATDVSVSSLTQGRIVVVGASGALDDDAGLTYNSSTDTLTTTTVVADLTGNVTGNVTGNLTGDVTGNVTGDLTGDVKAANGTVVLDAGTNGSDATFTGNVTGQVSDISNHTLDDIGDVDLTGLQDQDTIRWDAATNSWVPSISGGFQMRRQRFTANGSSPSFTLANAPEGRDFLIVTVSGVPQGGDTFTVTGTTLTLGGTPQNGEIVEVIDFSTGVFSPAPNSTDDIAEGSSNFYYSDTRVKTLMGNGTLNSDIIPAADITFDLGSSSKRWRDLYLSGNTIYLGAAQIKYDNVASAIKFVDSSGNPIAVDLGTTLDPDIQIDGGTF